MPFGPPLSSLRLSAANNSPGISTPPLAKNERYATFFPGQFGISTGRLGKFPRHSYRHHPHPLFSPIICSTWRGGRILSAGPLYSWRASDAVFGACLRMACTCLSQQHTGLWDVFLEAYQVLFSAGVSVCLIQAPNPGKSGPNMPWKSFHYLPENLQTPNFIFVFLFFVFFHKMSSWILLWSRWQASGAKCRPHPGTNLKRGEREPPPLPSSWLKSIFLGTMRCSGNTNQTDYRMFVSRTHQVNHFQEMLVEKGESKKTKLPVGSSCWSCKGG